MSRLAKIEWAAMMLAALLIISPLASVAFQKFMEARESATADHGTGLWHSYEWATLAVLLFQGWVYYRQKSLMGRQTDLMEEQKAIADRQTNIIASQLSAAQTAADAAKLSADAALWVEMPSFRVAVGIEGFAYDSTLPRVFVHAKNVGKSIALITAVALDVSVGKPPDSLLGKRLRIPLNRVRKMADQIDLIGDAPRVFHAEWTVSKEDRAEIYASKRTAWIFGYIEYIDFTGTVAHYGFCFGAMPPDPSKGLRSITWVRDGGIESNYHRRGEDVRPVHWP